MKEMTYFQAVFLAVLQGLTEFLPISSSGHLVIFQKLFGLKPPVFFDILVHFGTLGAILVYFRKRLIRILKGLFRQERKSWRLVGLLFLGTMPAVVFGLFLQNYLEPLFDSLVLVGFSLLFTSSLLFSTRKLGQLKHNFNQLKLKESFLIGCFQALAILPGVSRSGATIVSGLWFGLKRESAFQFSFLLAIPAISGALILQMPKLFLGQFNNLNQGILAMIIAGVTGYFSLKALERVLIESKLWLFGIYCLALGLITIF